MTTAVGKQADARSVAARRAELWAKRLDKERALGLHSGDEQAHEEFLFGLTVETAKLFLKATGLWAIGRRNAHAVKLIREDWFIDNLPPALNGYRILHLSDFHFPRFDPEFTNALRTALHGTEADCCVMTGDFKYGHFGRGEHVAPALDQVLKGIQTRDGHYAVLGNHDIAAQIDPLREIGITVLMNQGHLIESQDHPIWIAGTDDPHRYRTHDVATALNGAPDNAFKILLVHSPEAWEDAAEHGAHLYLCGHTHAGQVCLPGSGPIKLNARSPRRLADGHWRHGDVHGFTSPGLGVTDLPVRFFCPPRAHLFTLRPAQS